MLIRQRECHCYLITVTYQSVSVSILRHYMPRPQSTAFLPCDAMRCTVFVIVILSVCPSVCPSVTLVDCVHMVRPTIMIS